MNSHGLQYRALIVAAIVAICSFALALGLGAEYGRGLTADSTPIITSVLGLLAPTIVALLALLKVEKVDKKTDAVNEKVDGHITRMTEALVNHGVRPEDLPQPPTELKQP